MLLVAATCRRRHKSNHLTPPEPSMYLYRSSLSMISRIPRTLATLQGAPRSAASLPSRMAHRFEGLDKTCTFVSPCGPHEMVGRCWPVGGFSLYSVYQATFTLVKKTHLSQNPFSTRPESRPNLTQLSVRTPPQQMNFQIPSQRCSGALG